MKQDEYSTARPTLKRWSNRNPLVEPRTGLRVGGRGGGGATKDSRPNTNQLIRFKIKLIYFWIVHYFLQLVVLSFLSLLSLLIWNYVVHLFASLYCSKRSYILSYEVSAQPLITMCITESKFNSEIKCLILSGPSLHGEYGFVKLVNVGQTAE